MVGPSINKQNALARVATDILVIVILTVSTKNCQNIQARRAPDLLLNDGRILSS